MEKNKVGNVFLNILPSIDLHGYDKDSAIVKVNDFIIESILLKHREILIIHGIGEGILKKSIHESLARNKNALSYKLDNFNIGVTIVQLKFDKL